MANVFPWILATNPTWERLDVYAYIIVILGFTLLVCVIITLAYFGIEYLCKKDGHATYFCVFFPSVISLQ